MSVRQYGLNFELRQEHYIDWNFSLKRGQYSDSLRTSRSGDRIPVCVGGGQILHTRPDQPWGPPSLLYNGYWVSFPGVKRPGCCVIQTPSS